MPYVNVFWCFLPATTINDETQLAAWLDEFHAGTLSSALYTNRGNTLHVTQMEAVLYTSPTVVRRAVKTTSITGTDTQGAEPAGVCMVLSWHSSAYWRGGKPRTYLGGVTARDLDTNHSLTDTEKTAVIGQAQSFRTNINSITTPQVSETQLGFVHWQHHDVWLNPANFIKFTGVTVHDRVGMQRRRFGPWLP